MHKIVAGAFKAIFLSILFVIVFDVLFYIARVESLNQKIESVTTSMQQDITKNNYLTEDAYDMYSGILKGIGNDMNGYGSSNYNVSEKFVLGYNLNYDHACDAEYSRAMESAGLTPATTLNTPANYGDVAVIELKVTINALTWGYDRSRDGAANEAQHSFGAKEFTYMYQVPCLRYISVTK